VTTYQSITGDNIVIAYVDGICPLTMKGMDSVGSAHKKLMMPKKLRIVLTDEYRALRKDAQPTAIKTKMFQLLRNTYTDRNFVVHKNVYMGSHIVNNTRTFDHMIMLPP